MIPHPRIPPYLYCHTLSRVSLNNKGCVLPALVLHTLSRRYTAPLQRENPPSFTVRTEGDPFQVRPVYLALCNNALPGAGWIIGVIKAVIVRMEPVQSADLMVLVDTMGFFARGIQIRMIQPFFFVLLPSDINNQFHVLFPYHF